MTPRVAHIDRHPIKAIGREELESVELSAGDWMPFDRLWAVAHERAKLDGTGWLGKRNFLCGVTDPGVMAVTARLDEAASRLTLDHPKAGRVEFDPEDDSELPVLLDWLRHVWPADRPAATSLHRARRAHLTDSPEAWISIHTVESLAAFEERMGQSLTRHRFRGNLWLEGFEPWEEKSWVGRRLTVGDAVLRVREEITRCKTTHANPETGARDAEVLDALADLGHQEFGVFAVVERGGRVSRGNAVQVSG